MKIDAKGLHYRVLNEKIHHLIGEGATSLRVTHVNGQRYIGCGLQGKIRITVEGVAGNDLAAFMDGPSIRVKGNAQDGVANTLNAGEVIIDGNAGDVLGYGMRGGRVFIRGNVGYRVGIHMKSFGTQQPVMVVGGCARDFLGEYQAGGIIIVLGLDCAPGEPIAGYMVGTGMHGGVMYVRGVVEDWQVGREVKIFEVEEADARVMRPHLRDFARAFHLDLEEILSQPFLKMVPYSKRPYGRIYAY